MEFKYFNELSDRMLPIFTELGFEKNDGEIFLRNDFAVKTDYDCNRQVLILKGAKAKEGETLQFINLSEYLFCEDHTEKDLDAVVIDFEDTLRGELGLKKTVVAKKVNMPTRAAAGETPTIEAFTKGFLDIFPQYKDAYRDMLSREGSFMFVNFYKVHGVTEMLNFVNGGKTQKQLGKFLNFLNKYYTTGDRDVCATITTVFFGGAFYNNQAKFNEIILPKLDDMPYLKNAATEAINYVASHKKVRAIFE